MREAVIVAACRTAVGKAPNGTLKDTRPESMGTAVLSDLIKRAGDLDPVLIDDVIIGCTFPEATQGLNLGRILVMSMGWPDRVPGMTVNRFCSSGLQAIAIGAEKIMCGFSDVVIAGGVESMSQIPMGGSMMYPNPALVEMRPGAFTGMGLTAENVAERYHISRDEQDEFGAKSQQKAEAAIKMVLEEMRLMITDTFTSAQLELKSITGMRFTLKEDAWWHLIENREVEERM